MSLPWPDLTSDEWERLIAEHKQPTVPPEPTALTHRAKLAVLLGGPGSGNFGHGGRPGEVGGSASADGPSDTSDTKVQWESKTTGKMDVITGESITVRVGKKSDGGTLRLDQRHLPGGAVEHVLGRGVDHEDVAAALVNTLPGDVEARWFQWSDKPDALELQASSEDGVLMKRIFIRNPQTNKLEVRHEKFIVPHKAQGAGIAKRMMEGSFALYHDLGVTKVDTLASLESGGYAWAKFGYKAERPERLAAEVSRILKNHDRETRKLINRPEDLKPEHIAAARAILTKYERDPTLPWHLAGLVTADGRKVGRQLLIGQKWMGTIRLDDKESMARLSHYIKTPSTPKPTALTADAVVAIIKKRIALAFDLGGPGSGNFGHKGRPGEVGGSEGDSDGGAAGTGADGAGVRTAGAGSDAGGGSSGGDAVSTATPVQVRPVADTTAHDVANTYNAQRGLPPVRHDDYVAVNKGRAGNIADAYDALPVNDSANPKVREAYAALSTEIQDQWDHLEAQGYTLTPWTQEGQPYADSQAMVDDVRDNKRLYFFTGGEPHPLLGGLDPASGLSMNDKFRAIHDFYGHAAGGYGFGARGEENAWRAHSQMFTIPARRAMTTETRGQNSWVNFGRHNYEADGTRRDIPPQDRPFATQKVALLPDVYVLSRQTFGSIIDLGGAGSGNFDHAGRPGEVGGSAGSGRVGMRPASKEDGARLKALKVPPAWVDVHVSENPTADMQVVGTDAKGRTQYRYSAAHTERQKVAKFTRLREFNKALPDLRTRVLADLTDTSLSPAEQESAVVLHLIDATAFRPGSDDDKGGDVKAYGATTLRGGHVTVTGDKVAFRFTGKAGVKIAKTITNPALARELGERKARAGRGPLFTHASESTVLKYLKARAGDQFKVKDLRTWHGTSTAIKAIAKMPVPKTDKAFKKAQRDVAKVVSKHLGNTPAVALSSYIDPLVWSKWKVQS